MTQMNPIPTFDFPCRHIRVIRGELYHILLGSQRYSFVVDDSDVLYIKHTPPDQNMMTTLPARGPSFFFSDFRKLFSAVTLSRRGVTVYVTKRIKTPPMLVVKREENHIEIIFYYEGMSPTPRISDQSSEDDV